MNKEYTPIYRGFDSFFGMYNGMIDYYDHTHHIATGIPSAPVSNCCLYYLLASSCITLTITKKMRNSKFLPLYKSFVLINFIYTALKTRVIIKITIILHNTYVHYCNIT